MHTDERNRFDLTQGGILNKLLTVSLPLIGTQIIQMAYNLTDMFWLGRLGDGVGPVAASGTVGMYMWLSMAFMVLGARGAEIGVAQNTGRGDKKTAQSIAQAAMMVALVSGVALGLVYTLLSRPLVGFFNIQSQAVHEDAVAYLSIVGVGIPFTFITAAASGIFNGSGNARVPFVANITGLIINMVLDPIMIFNAGLGIRGAGYATIIAQFIACVIMLLVTRFHRTRPFEKMRIFGRVSGAHVKQILKWSAPIAVESFLFTFLSMIISRFVAGWGENAMATQRIGSQVESMSWLIGGGFSLALTAFVGQNFGALKWQRIRAGMRIAARAMGVWGAVATVVLIFLGRPLYMVFIGANTASEVVGMGERYLKILAVCQILACLEGIAAGAFRGIGKTAYPSLVSGTCNALRVVLAYVLMQTPLGLEGIWWAICLGAAARGLWLYAWYVKFSKRRMPREDGVPLGQMEHP